MRSVLVIDDEAAMRNMLRDILESVGYKVTEAANGVDGLASFRQFRPDLVITDILMPDKDGIESIREMRRVDPATRIIVVSGGGRAKYMNFLQVAKEFGAAEALEKPFRREQILSAIERVMKSG